MENPLVQKYQTQQSYERMLSVLNVLQKNEMIDNQRKKEMDEIKTFSDEYRWLSNFWRVDIIYNKIHYPTVEHAYQAQKTTDKLTQIEIANLMTPGEAKRAGKRLALRGGWASEKEQIMLDLLRLKFTKYKLRRELLQTGLCKLIEGNYWHDNFWGVCYCRKCGRKHPEEGCNALGRLLMQVRAEIRKEETNEQICGKFSESQVRW